MNIEFHWRWNSSCSFFLVSFLQIFHFRSTLIQHGIIHCYGRQFFFLSKLQLQNMMLMRCTRTLYILVECILEYTFFILFLSTTENEIWIVAQITISFLSVCSQRTCTHTKRVRAEKIYDHIEFDTRYEIKICCKQNSIWYFRYGSLSCSINTGWVCCDESFSW